MQLFLLASPLSTRIGHLAVNIAKNKKQIKKDRKTECVKGWRWCLKIDLQSVAKIKTYTILIGVVISMEKI